MVEQNPTQRLYNAAQHIINSMGRLNGGLIRDPKEATREVLGTNDALSILAEHIRNSAVVQQNELTQMLPASRHVH